MASIRDLFNPLKTISHEMFFSFVVNCFGLYSIACSILKILKIRFRNRGIFGIVVVNNLELFLTLKLKGINVTVTI